MKLLKMEIRNTQIFGDSVQIDFTTADHVRQAASDGENVLRVFPLKDSLYSQVLIAIAGINATGKTTLLQIILMALQILFEGASLMDPMYRPLLIKLMKRSSLANDQMVCLEDMKWILYFVTGDKVCRLESDIAFRQEGHRGEEGGSFYFKDETLLTKNWTKMPKWKTFDFTGSNVKPFFQNEERKQPYFRDTVSIAVRAFSAEEVKNRVRQIFSMSLHSDWNIPDWTGTADPRLIHCFDSNVDMLDIRWGTDSGGPEFRLSFKNQGLNQYGGNLAALGNFLSSGTIKGVNLLNYIVSVLSRGGYMLVDEMENHLNKTLVEWIFSLFEDKRTNPLGACLIFSTHYPELLDHFRRNDNIYITRKKQGISEVVRYSEAVKRKELSKSGVLLYNVIQGTAPKYDDVQAARSLIEQRVQERVHAAQKEMHHE